MQLSQPFARLLPSTLKAMETEIAYRKAGNLISSYKPYNKQRDFHAAGSQYRERLLMAGNQLGKTVAGAAECAYHMLGDYPDWWTGKRWDRPVVGWVAGVTGESTRDNVQRLLAGRPGALGTGYIPRDRLDRTTAGRGIADSVDSLVVIHRTGAESRVYFKSYEKGREKWQGETLDFVWFDEEPPQDIYTEGLTRTNATQGIVWMTFTPLMGMSDVVSRFLLEDSADRNVTSMTIDDVDHYTPEQRAQIIASYPPHEREARSKGIPVMGSGRVFPVTEEDVSVKPFDIPGFWPVIGAMDFGWDHPFAGVAAAWDRDADCIYITKAYRQREATPVIHAAALKPWKLPIWAWPHDGLQHDKGSGKTLAQQYRDQGLPLTTDHATFLDGGFGLEAGISEMLTRMQTGRLKVFEHLSEWFEEFRLYHRDKGLIVKQRDDLMSATRIAVMMMRMGQAGERKPDNDRYRRQQGSKSSWMAS